MPLALVALAWLLLMTGINGNYTAVGNQFETDVLNNGQGGGFFQFMAGLLGIAVFFRVIGMPNAGRVFLILVLIVFMLENANVLTALQNVGSATASTGANQLTAAPGSSAAAGAAATKAGGGSASTLLAYYNSLGQQISDPGVNAQAAVGGTLTGETSGTGSST
jgi:hypothetical protein